MTVLMNKASGVFKILIHYLKSDATDILERFVVTIRANPAFHECPYKVFSELHLDNAGYGLCIALSSEDLCKTTALDLCTAALTANNLQAGLSEHVVLSRLSSNRY